MRSELPSPGHGRFMGIALGLVSSAAFGMIPLFTLPLAHAGISMQTALVYRFSIAAVAMWLILFFKGERMAIKLGDLLKLILLSSLYLIAVAFFFQAFNYLPSGIVATIQFLYPVMVMLIMIFFFHEQFRWPVAIAVTLAVCGVGALSCGPGLDIPPDLPTGVSNIAWGVALSLLAGLSNGLYIVGIQVARIPHINGQVMTFYVMLFGAFFCLGNALFTNSLQWIDSWRELGIALLLALITAVFSNLTLIMAIKRIGSTLTSILGVMEPVTAVIIGLLVFHEPFSWQLLAGILLIIAAVLLALRGNGEKSAA